MSALVLSQWFCLVICRACTEHDGFKFNWNCIDFISAIKIYNNIIICRYILLCYYIFLSDPSEAGGWGMAKKNSVFFFHLGERFFFTYFHFRVLVRRVVLSFRKLSGTLGTKYLNITLRFLLLTLLLGKILFYISLFICYYYFIVFLWI